MVTPNALVEVMMYQFKAGDSVSQGDLEDWSWLGDDWENHVEDLPKEECSEGLRTEIQFTDHNPPTLRVTSDCVGFRFLVIGEGFGDFSCGLDWLLQEDGPDSLFEGCREIFLKMAEPHVDPEAVQENETLGSYVVRTMDKKGRQESRVRRIVTAWNYWSSRSYDGEYDCGVELLGLVRLGSIPYLAEKS